MQLFAFGANLILAIAVDEEFMNQVQFLLNLIFVTVLAFYSTTAAAFVAYETSPGVMELRARHDDGMLISNLEIRKFGRKQKSWVYFCAAEKNNRIVRSEKERCFYGPRNIFQTVRVGRAYTSIEYGLKNRILNDKGHISIGSERYFYPVFVLYELN